MKVILVRHGESLSNQLGIHSGWADIPLTDLGRRQAEDAGRLLRGIPFDRVYASDLRRAMDTARIALPDAQILPEPLVREINLGGINGRYQADCLVEYGQAYLDQKKLYDFTPFGGESHQQVTQRVLVFRTRLEQEEARFVAVFTHKGVLRAMVQLLMGMPFYQLPLRCGNAAIAVFDYSQGRWTLEGWNIGWKEEGNHA